MCDCLAGAFGVHCVTVKIRRLGALAWEWGYLGLFLALLLPSCVIIGRLQNCLGSQFLQNLWKGGVGAIVQWVGCLPCMCLSITGCGLKQKQICEMERVIIHISAVLRWGWKWTENMHESHAAVPGTENYWRYLSCRKCASSLERQL